MANRQFIAKKACTFRNREGGPARYYAAGDPMSIADDKMDVPEKLFTPMAQARKEASEKALTKTEVCQALMDAGIDFDKTLKAGPLRELLAQAAEGESAPADGDDMLS